MGGSRGGCGSCITRTDARFVQLSNSVTTSDSCANTHSVRILGDTRKLDCLSEQLGYLNDFLSSIVAKTTCVVYQRKKKKRKGTFVCENLCLCIYIHVHARIEKSAGMHKEKPK